MPDPEIIEALYRAARAWDFHNGRIQVCAGAYAAAKEAWLAAAEKGNYRYTGLFGDLVIRTDDRWCALSETGIGGRLLPCSWSKAEEEIDHAL